MNEQDNYRNSLLRAAASHNHEKIVKILIAEGADVNAQDDDGGTSLHWAATNGHTETTKALIDSGANVNRY